MLPAFRSNRDALWFAGVVAFFLVLPLILKGVGYPPREDVWKSASTALGAMEYGAFATFQEQLDPDVVVVGPSAAVNAIMPDLVAKRLSEILGRPATVRNLAISAGQVDIEYMILHDYLARHKPKLVLIEMPFVNEVAFPYQTMQAWARYGEFPDEFKSVPKLNKAQLYGDYVIGAPRQLLSLVRPNYLTANRLPDFEDNDYVRRARSKGWANKDMPDEPEDTQNIPSMSILRASDLTTVDKAHPLSSCIWRPSAYGIHFIKLAMSEVKQHGSDLIWMHVPTVEEFGWKGGVPVAPGFINIVGNDASFLSIHGDTLFPAKDEAQYRRYYINPVHLDKRGAIRFSTAIAPALASRLASSKAPNEPAASSTGSSSNSGGE